MGCGGVGTSEHNVSLEYSKDFGVTWNLLHDLPTDEELSTGAECLHELDTPTVYYPNAINDWRRVVIPLKKLKLCG